MKTVIHDRTVTERDLRMPEFRDGSPDEYEFRADGAIVRKDRWERGIRRVAMIITGGGRGDFEIDNLVHVVDWLVALLPDVTVRCEECGRRINQNSDVCTFCDNEY
jgi:hypothetical protein